MVSHVPSFDTARHDCAVQSNLVNMNSTGPSKKVHIKRNFTLTVARCMGVIVPGDFKRDFALNVFILTRCHCIMIMHRGFCSLAAFHYCRIINSSSHHAY